ncbi:unnamed protein product [Blepharisma stoltei]|uniref:Uncharacterized protein n=1 Tax=Blepharisma stoltei TaxID=1481888 RepID=A0AAU9IHP9_9CILI|nr:unnamed protein product [Blepharisma stoltei]
MGQILTKSPMVLNLDNDPNSKAKHSRCLYAFGCNSENQCGSNQGYIFREKIVLQASAGSSHNLVILKGGQLAAWGSNQYGQAGTQGLGWVESWIYNPPSIFPVIFERQFSKVQVTQISAGHWHSTCISDIGLLFTWGLGTSGQLGYPPVGDDFMKVERGKERYVLYPKLVESLGSIPMSHVACGGTFTVAVSQMGQVYTFGRWRYGVLGNGEQENRAEPKIVESLASVRVEKVACGLNHVLALTGSGKVYQWGNQSTNDDIADIEIPELLTNIDGATHISCGEHHSAVLCSHNQNNLYTWGLNNYGQLGHETSTRFSAVPDKVEIASKISTIGCGGFFTVALLKSGDLLGWGNNKYGQLRINQFECSKPTLILKGSLQKVSDVVCGHGHILVLYRKDVDFEAEQSLARSARQEDYSSANFI